MGAGTNCTAGSVENAELAAQNGADALLAVTPYYNKGTQAGLLAHYTAIADASPLPLVLYNVPSRTGVDLLPETVRALARHPHIAGIKEACGSISRAAQLLGRCGLPVWSGNDDQTAAIMALGGQRRDLRGVERRAGGRRCHDGMPALPEISAKVRAASWSFCRCARRCSAS